jgi:hypothetical protein
VRIWLFLALGVFASAQDRYRAVADQQVRGQPYTRYFTTDRFDRRIVSTCPKDQATRCRWRSTCMVPAHSRISFRPAGGSSGTTDTAPSRMCSAATRAWSSSKNPALLSLSPPARAGAVDEASRDFWREHTLERWSEAVSAALIAARSLPFIDQTKTLVLGHSEGGLVACKSRWTIRS